MQNKKFGKILCILGFILIIPFAILISGLVYYSSIGNLDFNIGILILIGNILGWIGWILLIIGVFIIKNFKRDWIYTIGLLFIGIIGFGVHIILGIALLIGSAFFALYLFEEGDKHGLIVAGIDIAFIVYSIIVALGYYNWIF